MGFFSRWSSFLFMALGWASFRDGLLFFLKPLDGLLFEMGFFSRLLLQTQEVGFFSRFCGNCSINLGTLISRTPFRQKLKQLQK